jgi:hypothetical protein
MSTLEELAADGSRAVAERQAINFVLGNLSVLVPGQQTAMSAAWLRRVAPDLGIEPPGADIPDTSMWTLTRAATGWIAEEQ